MGLRQSFFLLSVVCLLLALGLTFGVYQLCNAVSSRYPTGGFVIHYNGEVTFMEEPTPEQLKILELMERIRLTSTTWTSPFRRYPPTSWGRSAPPLKPCGESC